MILRIFALLFVALSASRSQSTTVYSTDFNSFPLGDDTVVGTDGWNGNNTGLGVHGVGEFITALGRSVYLGGARPASTFTTLFRTVNYAPVASATPIVDIDITIGIQDSTNFRRDSFFLSLYNSAGQFLAALQFDNTEANFGLYRSDGATTTDTGDSFFRNEIMLVSARIDFTANTWSVFVDDKPAIFDGVPFNTTGGALDLGSIAFEWQLTAATPAGFGDNFMLIDDLAVIASALPDPPPFTITAITLDAASLAPTITWSASPGFTYQLEYSTDLTSWLADLAGSSRLSPTADTLYSFTDTAAQTQRFYRIRRTPTQ